MALPDPMTRYSHTRRIVVLIDLAPPQLHHEPHHCTKRLVSFFETLFSFSPLSSSLFAFKLFFSSLFHILHLSRLVPQRRHQPRRGYVLLLLEAIFDFRIQEFTVVGLVLIAKLRESRMMRDGNVRVQLSLGILDVNGSPIEYSCCGLEFVNVKVNSGLANLQGGGCERRERFWKVCLEGGVKLEAKVVRRCEAVVELGGWLSDSVPVHEVFRGSKKKEKESLDGSFADRVLELVASEFGCEWR
ncbi:hypothetical protein E2542_SST09259 [Spatholobus suberectus]|nr:hypothetical protein E2542_SST09259 [Spatholobus suberectus]